MAELFRKILSPVNFDEQSLAVVPYVKQLAEQNNSTVYLTHFVTSQEFDPDKEVERPGKIYTKGGEWRSERAAKEHLEQIAQEQLSGVRCEITARLMEDQLGGILGAQKESGADVIVMATHARTGMAHLLRGSVTEKVVRESPCPVFSVRGGADRTGSLPLRKILVSVDVEDKALDVLTYAKHLAQQNQSTVYPLHIVPTEKVELQMIEIYRAESGGEPDLIHAQKAAKANLEKLAREHLSGVQYEPIVHASGNAGKTIIEVEKDLGADVLVIATHGLRGVFHILLGSLTERMVRESRCPVFSVHRR